MDNYEKQVYTGRELFLKYNQDKLIEKYGLKHDEEYLYLKYIETEYRINRRNGAIEYATGEEWTDCRFVTAGSSPSTDPFVEKYARAFSGKVEEVKQACICLGGKQTKRLAGADLTFEMPVLPEFSVLFQFWDGDEEFPPKILLLWDKVSLSYLHFETTYYLQGDLLKAILQIIG